MKTKSIFIIVILFGNMMFVESAQRVIGDLGTKDTGLSYSPQAPGGEVGCEYKHQNKIVFKVTKENGKFYGYARIKGRIVQFVSNLPITEAAETWVFKSSKGMTIILDLKEPPSEPCPPGVDCVAPNCRDLIGALEIKIGNRREIIDVTSCC